MQIAKAKKGVRSLPEPFHYNKEEEIQLVYEVLKYIQNIKKCRYNCIFAIDECTIQDYQNLKRKLLTHIVIIKVF